MWLDKLRKRIILEQNKFKGKLAEDLAAMQLMIEGYEVRKVHKGKDFVAVKRDFFTGEIIDRKFVEVKAGNSQLSEAQRRSKARSKKYEIWRFW